MKSTSLVIFFFYSLYLILSIHSYGRTRFNPLQKMIDRHSLKQKRSQSSVTDTIVTGEYSPVYVSSQDGLKAANKIESLPGQPDGVNFNQYSGYVTVDPGTGKALFYYLTESQNISTKPLVLLLNGDNGICISKGHLECAIWSCESPFRRGRRCFCFYQFSTDKCNFDFVLEDLSICIDASRALCPDCSCS